MSVDTPNHPGVDWQDHTIDAGDRQIPIRVFTPLGDDPPDVLVWAHGGSWVSGSVEEWHGPCALMAALAAVTVVSVDYRLAPMHHHPAALLDILAALDWAQTRFAPLWLGVGGDSAGGTLAANAAVARRNAGTPLAAQVLAYPPLDPTCDSAAYHAQPQVFPSRNRMLAAWRTYTWWRRPGLRDRTPAVDTLARARPDPAAPGDHRRRQPRPRPRRRRRVRPTTDPRRGARDPAEVRRPRTRTIPEHNARTRRTAPVPSLDRRRSSHTHPTATPSRKEQPPCPPPIRPTHRHHHHTWAH